MKRTKQFSTPKMAIFTVLTTERADPVDRTMTCYVENAFRLVDGCRSPAISREPRRSSLSTNDLYHARQCRWMLDSKRQRVDDHWCFGPLRLSQGSVVRELQCTLHANSGNKDMHWQG